MGIMFRKKSGENVKNKQKKQVFKSSNPKKMTKEVVETYQRLEENGEKDIIDNTVKKIMEIMNSNPDEEIARQLLKDFLKTQAIPDSKKIRIFEKTSTKISITDKIPDSVITQVVNDPETQIPDESIDKIIEEGNINVRERFELVSNVEDSAILNKRIEDEFEILYGCCWQRTDEEVVQRIEKLEKLSGDKDFRENNLKQIRKIIAKKMAENEYNDSIRMTRVFTLSRIMPYEKMIEENLPYFAKIEYNKLQDEYGVKPNRFSEKELKLSILDKIANDVVRMQKSTNILSVPFGVNAENLTPDEEEAFVKKIQVYENRELDSLELAEIRSQIRGQVQEENIQNKEDSFIKKVKQMSLEEKSKYIGLLEEIVGNSKKLETISMLEESNVLNSLVKVSEKKRKLAIKSIGNVLEKRQYNVAEKTPSVKSSLKKMNNNFLELDKDSIER